MNWYHWILMAICFAGGWWIRSKFDKQVDAIQETLKPKPKPPTA
jgi:hypothetical protein